MGGNMLATLTFMKKEGLYENGWYERYDPDKPNVQSCDRYMNIPLLYKSPVRISNFKPIGESKKEL
jgi:hypothetical protein